MKRILVTGASGFIGSHVVPALVQQGYKVRCFVRISSKIGCLSSLSNVELCYGDMNNMDSLLRATDKVNAVIHLAAFTSEQASSADESYRVNVEGMQNLINACEKNKVSRLIVVSSQSTKREKQGNYGYTKKLADEFVLKSTLNWTIVKPTLVYGKGSRGLFTKIIGLLENLPVIPVVGSGDYQLQPTYIDDLVHALVAIVNKKQTFRKVYDLAGESRISFNELLTIVNEELQQRKKMVHVPFSLCYGGIKTLSLFTKNPPVTTDNLLGLVQETNIDLAPAREDFGYDPLSFREGIRRTLWGDLHDFSRKKIGIIGLGKMGLLHASIVNAFPNAKITALFDVNPALKSQMYSLNIKAPFFTDLDKFLNSSKLDAVFISVPPAFTLSTIEKCASRGIHVFVEKPLASELAKAQKIVNLLQQHTLKSSVGYMYAYRPLIQKAKEILSSNVLGSLSSFDASSYVTQVLSPKKGWRYQKSTAGGGCMTLQGTHLLYLLYHFFGLPQQVSAQLYFPFSAVEDKAYAQLSYSSGLKGAVKVSWSEQGYPSLTLAIIVHGKNGSLQIQEDRLILTLKGAKKAYAAGTTEIFREDLPSAPFELGGEGYYLQDKAFIDSLFNKNKSFVDAEDGYNVQRMLQAVYDSYEQQQEVGLP